MRKLLLLVFVFLSHQINAQIPKDLQGYWQFKVDKPGDWNGFEIGEDYIESFYQIYKVRSVEKIDGKILLALDAPNNIVYEFLENAGPQRNVKISTRKDTILCTQFDRDPDIDYIKIEESSLTRNNWLNSKDLKQKLVFDSNSLQIGSDIWNIRWFGKYKLNNEYRTLVEHNGIKRLLYLSPNKNSLKMVYDMKPHFYSKEGPFPAVYDFIGNYYDSKSNDWKYGFFEEFALIEGQTAFYNTVEKRADGFKVTFFDKKKYKPIHIKVIDKKIIIDKVTYTKVDKFLPSYSGKDTSSFYDSKFSKLDTAIISGYIRNNNSTDPFSVGVNNWLNGEAENFYGDVDEYGFFTVKVPLYNTSQVFIDWRRSNITDVLTPGEKYFLYKDLSTGETIFQGKNARFHNELVKYKNYTSGNNIYPKTTQAWQAKNNYERSLKDTSYLYLKLAQLDSLRKINLDFLNQNNLSNRSKYFINKETDYTIARDLMQKKFQLNYQTKEKFSEKYMNTVKNNFFDHNVVPISLIRDNQIFLRDYLDYQSRFLDIGNDVLYHDEIVVKLINNGDIEANAELKKYAALNLRKILKTISDQDSIEFSNFIKQDSSIVKRYSSLVAESSELIDNAISQEFQVVRHIEAYENIAPEVVKNLFLSENILSLFKNRPIPLSDKNLKDLTKSISNQFLKSQIVLENEKLKKIASGELKYADNLKNTDHLKEAKDADKIIAEILAPHKGKVVYMDFWGTWCGPCVAEMEYAPAAKMAVADKDVVFIYMANSTPKAAWENFIKAKNLEGANVIHYNLPSEQQSMVERRLEINGFPTYMIFDREGGLVNNQAPRPSNLNALVKEIEKLLE